MERLFRKFIVSYLTLFGIITWSVIEAFDPPNAYFVYNWFMIKASDLDIYYDVWENCNG